MDVFRQITAHDHEQVLFCNDPASGLRAIIAIHSTRLGPSLGGTRFYPYPDEGRALADALRLSRAMTAKAAVAGLDLGGGKAVIIGDPATTKTEPLLRAFARHVHSLGGRYITAEDVGTATADIDLMRRDTPHVVGLSTALGGSGDPSPATAVGVVHAMRAVAEHLWGDDDLTGRHVVVAGTGKVGDALARRLTEAGARVSVANRTVAVAHKLAAEIGATVVPYETSHAVPCDLYAPCALGGVLDATTVPQLQCRAVVGSANNQLAAPEVAGLLQRAGIVYGPDYVVNAGGLINAADERSGYRAERAAAAVATIRQATATVLARAAAESVTTAEAAERVAADRIAAMGAIAMARPAAGPVAAPGAH